MVGSGGALDIAVERHQQAVARRRGILDRLPRPRCKDQGRRHVLRAGEASGEIERHQRAAGKIRLPILFEREDQLPADEGAEARAQRQWQTERSAIGQQVALAFEEIDLTIEQHAAHRAIRIAQYAGADADIGCRSGEDLLGGIERGAAA